VRVGAVRRGFLGQERCPQIMAFGRAEVTTPRRPRGALSPAVVPAPAMRACRRVSLATLSVLIVLMALSSVTRLWALHRDLPLADPDEEVFVQPAVHMAATGDLNPHWFGHPGSTVIYPLAGVFHVWDALAHHGPILLTNPALTARLKRSPTEFYVIGRLWSIVLSVGALPLLFLVGRRAFNTRVALIAVAIWAALPEPVSFACLVRTDSAGVFFGLLALWLCFRLLDEPRTRWCVLAGLGVGLAIASRYFMVALVPCLVVAAILPHRHALRRAFRSAAIALVSSLGAFVASTPFLFLDWHTALDSLRAERDQAGPPALSPLGNLRWYLGTAIPHSTTWPLVALAAAGVVLVMWRRRPPQMLLVAFSAVFLAGVCASKLHWEYWVLQILPVVVLLAAVTVDALVHASTAQITRVSRASIIIPVAITGVLVIQPIGEVVDTNAHPGTGSVARDWIRAHTPRGTRIGVDSVWVGVSLHHTGRDVDYRLNPIKHTVADYQHAGYQYLVVNQFWGTYLTSLPYPRQAAFYRDLACRTQLVAAIDETTTRPGWPIAIYRLTHRPRTHSSPAFSGLFPVEIPDDRCAVTSRD
jgi:Dolichyl-phosphate-mannose-protein mannosyltransferase